LAPAGSAHDQYALVVVDGGARGLQGGLAGTVVVTAQQQVDRVRAAGGGWHHHPDYWPGRAAAGTFGYAERHA
jgi:hypothetical protein